MSAVPTFAEMTKAMNEALELDGKLKSKFNAVVKFDVDGQSLVLDARKNSKKTGGKGEGQVGKAPPKVDLHVKMSQDVLRDLMAKKMTAQQAFMKGKLKIKGNMGLAMKLSAVMDATRKHLAQQASRL